ncbi:MAG: hypothetical protein NTX88_02125 [Candidatus Atribacteria bacterium]|nr:hypothetical protein [Candidatus Atribacteria bacterium]
MSRELEKYVFEGPYELSKWIPLSLPGVYATYVHRITSPSCEPYEGPIYIGETNNLADRGFPRLHEKYESWNQIAGKDDVLYIYYCDMTDRSDSLRKSIEAELINLFNPICNIKL